MNEGLGAPDDDLDVESATVLLRPSAGDGCAMLLEDDVDVESATMLLPSGTSRGAAEDDVEPVAAPAAAAEADLVGERLGHYELVELIGRGSFGRVYRATDSRLDRDVAIKVAEPRLVRNPALMRQFRQEARIQARLEHANIVPIYDLLEEGGRLSIVMRLIRGEDLDRRLGVMVRPFTPIEAVPILDQITSAVGSAHDKGVLHKDLKPGNIRITPHGEAVVLDFGIAAVGPDLRSTLGAAGGTPGYMSPEHVRGDPMDARSDIYSLAMTMYKALTAHHPFEDARNLSEMLDWQVAREPAPPTHFNPWIPEALSDAILRALAKDPRDRYRGCTDFLRAVATAVGGAAEAIGAGGDNARWNPRADVNLAARLKPDGGEPLPARVVNLSVSGVAVRVDRPLERGMRAAMHVHIPLKGAERVVRCRINVMRAVPAEGADGLFDVGVCFEDLAPEDHDVFSRLVRAILVHRGG